jgi:hypothetical protein
VVILRDALAWAGGVTGEIMLKGPVRGTLAALLMLIAASPVRADSIRSLFGDGTQSGCFKRIYSKAHLAKHPGQRVKMIEFAYAPATDPAYRETAGPIAYGVSLTLRSGRQGRLGNVALCRNEGSTVQCGLEGDGGAFSLSETNGKLTMSVINAFVFETEKDFISLGEDDRVFVLNRVAARNCEKP